MQQPEALTYSAMPEQAEAEFDIELVTEALGIIASIQYWLFSFRKQPILNMSPETLYMSWYSLQVVQDFPTAVYDSKSLLAQLFPHKLLPRLPLPHAMEDVQEKHSLEVSEKAFIAALHAAP